MINTLKMQSRSYIYYYSLTVIVILICQQNLLFPFNFCYNYYNNILNGEFAVLACPFSLEESSISKFRRYTQERFLHPFYTVTRALHNSLELSVLPVNMPSCHLLCEYVYLYAIYR